MAYVPPGMEHQLVNEGSDEWLDLLIVSGLAAAPGSDGRPVIVNWRGRPPSTGVHGAAVTWLLLESVAEPDPGTEYPCLLSMYYIAKQALVRGSASDAHTHDDKEQVYHILEGWGMMITNDEIHQVAT